MAYVIYLDQLLLVTSVNFLFDFLLLWATREILKLPVKRSRLLMGAAVGSTYFIVHRLAFYSILPFYGVLSSPITMLTVSLLMLGAAFYPLPKNLYVSVMGYFYLIFLSAGGAGTLASTSLFGTPQHPQVFLGALTSIGVLLIIAELGWGLIQRQIWQHLYQITLSIQFDDNSIMVKALVDSGNRLREPISGSWVIIIEHETLKPLLPSVISHSVEEVAKGNLDILNDLPEPWSAKFRILPYYSVGKSNGMLLGLRSSSVHMLMGEKIIPLGKGIIIGICSEKLCPDGVYKALIHPHIIQGPLTREGANLQEFQDTNQIQKKGRKMDVTN